MSINFITTSIHLEIQKATKDFAQIILWSLIKDKFNYCHHVGDPRTDDIYIILNQILNEEK